MNLLKKKVLESSFTVTVPGESKPLQTMKDVIVIGGQKQSPRMSDTEEDDSKIAKVGGVVGGMALIAAAIVFYMKFRK